MGRWVHYLINKIKFVTLNKKDMPLVNSFKKAGIDLVLAEGTIKAMILNNSHTTNIDTQEFIDDVSANEVSGVGYTSGGQALTGVATSIDTGTDTVKLDADNITFSTVTISNARFVAYYVDTGVPGTSRITNIVDFGSDQSRAAEDLVIEIATGGILDLA